MNLDKYTHVIYTLMPDLGILTKKKEKVENETKNIKMQTIRNTSRVLEKYYST